MNTRKKRKKGEKEPTSTPQKKAKPKETGSDEQAKKTTQKTDSDKDITGSSPKVKKKKLEKEEKKKEEEKDEKSNTKTLKIITDHLKELRKTEKVIFKYGEKQLSKHKEKYSQVAYAPYEGAHGTLYDKEDKFTKCNSNPLHFIKANAEVVAEFPQLAENKDAIKIKLLKEAEKWLIDQNGELLVPCFPHTHYLSVRDMAIDHDPAKADFKKCQANIIKLMNNDESLVAELKKESDFDQFFIEIPEGSKEYYGTRYFYELGFNNVCALGLLCHVCNTDKSDREIMDWMEMLELKEEFEAHLKQKGITIPAEKDEVKGLETLNTQLAQVAKEWLKERSESIMSIYKEVEEFSLTLKAAAKEEHESSAETSGLVTHTTVQVAGNVLEGIRSLTKELAKDGEVKASELKKDIESLPAIVTMLTDSKALQSFDLAIKEAAGKHFLVGDIDKEKTEAAMEVVFGVAKAAMIQAMKTITELVKHKGVNIDHVGDHLAPMKEHIETLTLDGIKKYNEKSQSFSLS